MQRRLLPFVVAIAAASAALPARADWLEASTDHFLIYADASENWTRDFAEKLERFDSAMRLVRSIPRRPGDKANRVVIYVLPDISALQDLVGRGGGSVGAFYVPRLNPVIFTPQAVRSARGGINPYTALFHEYSHHLMWKNTNIVYPMWLSEGFAELNGNALIGDDGRVEIGRPATERAGSLMNSSALTVSNLIKGEIGNNGDLFYGRSWLLTHMLTFDPSRRGQLDTYVKLISDGTDSFTAAGKAFGDLAKLNRDVNSYINKGLSALPIPASKITVGTITLRPLRAGEAAIMPVRLRSQRGVDKVMAARVVVEARRRAAPYPADPAVQVALAEAEYDAGNDAEAEAAADRALAADPRSIHAMLYKGQALVRRAEKAKSTDTEEWRRARSWYIKAATANPDAAEPLALFYRSFGAQDVAPTANAAAALYKAFELAPQDRNLRFAAARQLLHDGKTAQARAMLMPLTFDAHGNSRDNFATRLVKMVDAGDPADKIAAAKPDKGEGEDEEKDGEK